MRLPLRSLASLALAVGVATCADAPSTSPRPANGIAKGRLAITPVFSKEAAATLAQRGQFADITFDQVHVIITRPPSEVVFETTVPFTPTSSQLTIDPTIEVRTVGEVFEVTLEYLSNGVPVFRGSSAVTSHAIDQPAPPAQPIVIQFVGPGANAVRVVVAPKTVSVEGIATRTFTATATDAAGNGVGTPVTWTSSDLTVATIDANTGVLTTLGKRGTTTVTARTPTNLSDNAVVTVTLPASSIALVSGGGQTGRVGTTLAQPAVVRVTASDNQPVAGVTVIFAAPVGGGVGSASVTTDAAGQASTSLTLGSTVGPQSFSASAGALNVSIPATATPGTAAAIQAVSGGGQADTIRRTLRAPLVARVTDQFGNPTAGVTVSWSTSGPGTVGAATSVTNAGGDASVTYTLGGTPGGETITATATGASGAAIFNVTAFAAGAADLFIVSGNGQTGRTLQPLANPFVVTVIDASGSTVAGAAVTWAATNGSFPTTTMVTDAAGQARNTMTLGATAGPASATATIQGGKSVTFTATAQSLTPTAMAFRTGPSTVGIGAVMTPPVVVELRDAQGSVTAVNNTVTIALGANPGEANLTGTLSRAAVNGVATFDDLRISQAANGYTLVASSTGLPNVTSAPFNVTPLSITLVDGQTLQPIPPPPPTVTMVAGKAPVNPPAIKIGDANGVGQPNVTIAYTVNRNSAVVFGGNATTDSRGIITFDALLISPSNLTTAGNYIFSATLNGASGSPINLPVTVVPDAPAALRFNTTAFPTTGSAGATLTPAIQVAVTDQYGNVEPSNTDNITIAITPGTGTTGAVLNGTKTRAAVNSIATFNDLSIDRAGTGYTLTATTPTVAGGVSVVSPAITIGPGAAVKFLVTATPANIAPGATSALSAQLVDANNTPVPTPTPRAVSWTFVNTGVGSINPPSTTTNAQGVATATYTAPSQSGGTSTIQATDVNATNINGQVTVTVTVPTGTNLAAPTPTNVALMDASQPFPANQYPLVRLTSASGAPVPGTPITFNFIGGDCIGPSENSSTVVTTDANGNAQLTSANYLIDRTRAHSCIVSAANASGSLNSGVISVVILPTTPIRSWIGATNTSWTTATNWYNGIVPTAGDSVYVSAYLLNRPILQAATTISTLRLENFAPAVVDIASFPLTITGDLQNSAGAIVGSVATTGVFFTGTGNRTLTGSIATPVTVGGPTCGTFTLTLGSAFSTADLTLNCTLVIPAVTAAIVSGRFRTQGANGRLQMTPETGSSSGLITAGDAIFDGASESGFLTSGSITVGGNLIIGSTNSPTSFVSTQDLNFQTGNHTITIAAGATPSFGALYVFNGNVAVAGTGNLTAKGTIVGVGGSLSSPGTITVQGALGQSGGNYNGVANLVVTGPTFPEIDGQTPVRTVLTGATITPFSNNTFAGSIEVQGRLVVSSNITLGGNLLVTGAAGEVSMSSSTTLSVAGNVTFAGKQSTLLTSGTLVVGGNFTQASTVSAGSFAPSAAFITRFGTGSKTVTLAAIDSSSAQGSHFGTIDVLSGSSVTFNSRIIALGDITTSGSMTFVSGFSTIGAQGGTSAFRSGSSTTVDGAGVHIRGTTQFDATGVTVTTVNNGSISIENCPANKPSNVGCPS